MGDEFEFKIIQGEIVVAEGSGPNGDAVYVEAMHYARQYAEDGPCIVRLSRSQSIAISKSGFVERN